MVQYKSFSPLGSSFGGYGIPDRSRDISRDNLRSQFLGASGSRQGGYYHSATPAYRSTTYGTKQGEYLGNGKYVED